jgi:hypothetical protein
MTFFCCQPMSSTPVSPILADSSLLQDRDYTIILARTATSYPAPPPAVSERWQAAQAAVLNLVQQCEALDPDGITLYVSCRGETADCQFRKYNHVTSENLIAAIEENYPPEEIDLQVVLPNALNNFLSRKAAQTTKANGETILVILDGEPQGRLGIARTIMQTSQQLDRDSELGIGFVQIGQDPIAQGFLQLLDDDLQAAGAKFDIVDTQAIATITPSSLTDFLLNVLND